MEKKRLFLSLICFCFCILMCIVFYAVCKNKEGKDVEVEVVLFDSNYSEEEKNYPGKGIDIPIFVNSYKHIERELYLEDFKFIKIGTSVSEVETRLGKPNGTTGFGIMSKYYHLSDNSAIVIRENTKGIYGLRHCTFDENGKTNEVWILR